MNEDEMDEGRALSLTFKILNQFLFMCLKKKRINYKTFPTQMSLMDTLTQCPALQNFNFSQVFVRLPGISPQMPFLFHPSQRQSLSDSYQTEFHSYQGKSYHEFHSLVCGKTGNLRIIKITKCVRI